MASLSRFRFSPASCGAGRSRAAGLGPFNQRAGQRWPVEQPMEGWLQWDGHALPAIPVEIANFSAGGAGL